MPGPAAPLHILVIDDAPQILALCQAVLGHVGYRVTTDSFRTRVEPLVEAIRGVHPDLIILVLFIREEQRGWHLMQGLKLDRETWRIPVIVCSAAVELVTQLQPQLEAMGARVLPRPFHIEGLVEVTAQALRHPRRVPGRKQGTRRHGPAKKQELSRGGGRSRRRPHGPVAGRPDSRRPASHTIGATAGSSERGSLMQDQAAGERTQPTASTTDATWLEQLLGASGGDELWLRVRRFDVPSHPKQVTLDIIDASGQPLPGDAGRPQQLTLQLTSPPGLVAGQRIHLKRLDGGVSLQVLPPARTS